MPPPCINWSFKLCVFYNLFTELKRINNENKYNESFGLCTDLDFKPLTVEALSLYPRYLAMDTAASGINSKRSESKICFAENLMALQCVLMTENKINLLLNLLFDIPFIF